MLSAHPKGALDEQGVPAYLEGFYWSRYIFWRRILFLRDSGIKIEIVFYIIWYVFILYYKIINIS